MSCGGGAQRQDEAAGRGCVGTYEMIFAICGNRVSGSFWILQSMFKITCRFSGCDKRQ